MSRNKPCKPSNATQGQSTSGRRGPTNRSGGGAPGQSMSKSNRRVKPSFGTQGQRLAGSRSSGAAPPDRR